MQNIGAANAGDEFYRYKMPKLVAKIEGRGNGIKTNVVNNVDIAKALERPPEYVLKYYGCELGAQTNFDAKTGTCIVNGAHDNNKLAEVLEGFIKKYVQCYSCGNPETRIKVKREHITLKCKACGAVSDVDPRHKLNTFILKNPPEEKISKEEKRLKKAEEERMAGAEKVKKEKSKKEKKDKKEKKKKSKSKDRDDGDNDDSGSGESGGDDDDGVVWMTDTSAEAARKRAEEQLTAATAAMVTQGNIEAEEEAARKKAEKEAAKARKEAEEEKEAAEAAAAAAAAAAASSGSPEAQRLRALIDSGASADDVASAVKELDVAGGLPGKVAALYEAVFLTSPGGVAPPPSPSGGPARLVDALTAHKELLAALAGDPVSQLAQVIALEWLTTTAAPSRAKELPLVLKAMYDEDLADDEIILAWAGKEDAAKALGVGAEEAQAARKAAAPVVEWLEESEDDE